MVNRLVLSRKQVQWHLNPWSMAANRLHHAFNGVAIAVQVQNTEVPDQAKYADPDYERFPTARANALGLTPDFWVELGLLFSPFGRASLFHVITVLKSHGVLGGYYWHKDSQGVPSLLPSSFLRPQTSRKYLASAQSRISLQNRFSPQRPVDLFEGAGGLAVIEEPARSGCRNIHGGVGLG